MRRARSLLRRLLTTLFPARAERELADELASHFQLHVDDNIRAGMSPAEARRAAILKFGPVESLKDAYRDRASFPLLGRMAQDLRFAARQLRKTPVFSVTTIATITLAVGVNAAIFTVLNAAALQPIRVPQGDALVGVTLRIEGDGTRGVHGAPSMLSWPEFLAVRDQVRAFSGAAAFSPFNAVTLGGEQPRQIIATMASCEYFDVLQVRPALGRAFVRADCDPGASPVAVISDAVWRTAFGGDPAIVSRTVSINRTPFTVIGVTPASFSGTQLVAEDAYLPVTSQLTVTGRTLLDNANMSWLFVIGRLRPHATIAAARADLSVVAARINADQRGNRRLFFDASRATLSGLPEIRVLVLGVGGIIVAAVGLVLLIACANIANLLLARSTARRREFAIRMAIGASRARVVQQLLTESLLLAALGGSAGFVLAQWGTRVIVQFIVAHLPHGAWPVVFDPRPDVRVLAYVAALTTLTGIAFGLVPALRGTRDAALEFRSGMATDRRGSRRLRNVLVTLQVAVCLVLLLSAGLLGRGLYRAQTIDPGLTLDGVSVVSYDLRGAGYSPDAAAAFQQQAVERLSSLPGIRSVAQTSAVPLSDQHTETAFNLDADHRRYLEFSLVSPSYFDLLGIPIVRGRTFSAAELASQRAAIVTETTARRLWPGADPLTQSLVLNDVVRPIVGVVRDSQVSRLGSTGGDYVFLPIAANVASASRSAAAIPTDNANILIAATAATPSLHDIGDLIRSLDRGLAVEVSPLAANLEQWRAPSIVVAVMAGALALLALVLACTGVFGTVAYTVSRRVREIGVRVALGASHDDVIRLIVREGMRPVLIGMGIGLIAAAAATAVLEKMLFGVSPHDPLSFAAATAVLVAIAATACYVPARRALKIAPTVALRTD